MHCNLPVLLVIGNVIVSFSNWEASHRLEASKWSHHAAPVNGGNSWGGHHRGSHFFFHYQLLTL
ncbi:hypothetical protein GLYMA_18G182350v4 [Glycine max]|nr:hypothetical protein GLYMA_18G182350v4 [Glycine max]KAH1155031.1 hypothetical protein GYH30_050363 [Glycine max]